MYGEDLCKFELVRKFSGKYALVVDDVGTVTDPQMNLFSRAFSACKNDTEIAI